MDKYVFRPYDPVYVELFNEESYRLKKLLGKILIEHVGSTAIPGLGGKGFVDIAIAVDKKDLQGTSSKLVKAGYEFKPEVGTDDRLYHQQIFLDDNQIERMYHIHLTYYNSQDWNELISFRNYLRTHKKDTKRYADIKKHAAKVSNQEREIYVKTKDPIVLELIKVAMKS